MISKYRIIVLTLSIYYGLIINKERIRYDIYIHDIEISFIYSFSIDSIIIIIIIIINGALIYFVQ